jgi:hypothetical protein
MSAATKTVAIGVANAIVVSAASVITVGATKENAVGDVNAIIVGAAAQANTAIKAIACCDVKDIEDGATT